MFFELIEIVRRIAFGSLTLLLKVVEPFGFFMCIPIDLVVAEEFVVISVNSDVFIIPRQPPAGQELPVPGTKQGGYPPSPGYGVG